MHQNLQRGELSTTKSDKSGFFWTRQINKTKTENMHTLILKYPYLPQKVTDKDSKLIRNYNLKIYRVSQKKFPLF